MESYSAIPNNVDEITFSKGKFNIVGDLIYPENCEKFPVLVFIWGSGPAGRGMIGRPSQLISAILEAGCGIFIQDKPGTGMSTGVFDEENLLSERSMLLEEEVRILNENSKVESIGFYGSSQGAYIMAMAIERGARPDFLAAVSCPMQNSVEQSAYLIYKQLLCAGYGKKEAEKLRQAYIDRECSRSYQAYLKSAYLLDENPVIRDELNWGGLLEENEYKSNPTDWDEFYDPAKVFSSLEIPLLAIFGEQDTQIDPVQGVEVLGSVVSRNDQSSLFVLPATDHNMRPTRTGCLKEQKASYAKPGGLDYQREFLKMLTDWLSEL